MMHNNVAEEALHSCKALNALISSGSPKKVRIQTLVNEEVQGQLERFAMPCPDPAL